MAILWSGDIKGVHYEVRAAGHSRRLYTNGVFHSQFNPRQPVTGGVWDLLMLPAFFEPRLIRRVLVLGVGGGAVLRQLQRFIAPESITGIELDAVHLRLARRYFGLGGDGLQLLRADAVAWLRDYQGPLFDMIVDDLFGEAHGEPVRAVRADGEWLRLLLRRLRRNGVLVMNFCSRSELLASAPLQDRRVAARFQRLFELYTPLEENRVGVFLRRPADSRRLRANLQREPLLDTRRSRCRLRYRIRRLG
ncbi:oxidoreductase [Thiohalobacter sp. IOR34]|uniref:spermidine synthase n=1 Tax=Thiohalobacter sp. IOR34 TaxID=3057176 RepID=UPI0025B144BB|nr:oxidoreductase [Thiohalobacter sp. IOR34]WJW76335.1 oxidoreductase [Thiohalobacter sp. IOR34]